MNYCRDGYVNTTLKVEKIHLNVGDKHANDRQEPKNILFKKYGGNIFGKEATDLGVVNSPMTQSLIAHELSTRGWGPKVYGLLEDGRIEEFVDAHDLRPEEGLDEDIAVAYARFHSIKLPIKQERLDIVAKMMQSLSENKQRLRQFLDSTDMESEQRSSFEKVYNFPFQEEKSWLNCIGAKIKQRIVLSTMDPNYLNRLVRNVNPTDPDTPRILFIDFDMTSYSDRGYDLAGHFVNRMFNAPDSNNKMSGLSYPSESERNVFLSVYLKEAKRLFEDFDENHLDSLENLILEVDFNAMGYAIVILLFCVNMHAVYDQKPSLTTIFKPLIELYNTLKVQFQTKYSKLALN